MPTIKIGPLEIEAARPKATTAMRFAKVQDFDDNDPAVGLIRSGFYIGVVATSPPWPMRLEASGSAFGSAVADWLVEDGAASIMDVMNGGGEAAALFGSIFGSITNADVDSAVGFSEAQADASS